MKRLIWSALGTTLAYLGLLLGQAAPAGAEEHGGGGHKHAELAAKPESGHAHGAEDDDEHEEHDEDESGVAFKKGRGLSLSPEVVGALGVKTASAEPRTLSTALTVRVHVFALAPASLAFATVPAAAAASYESASVSGARLLRVDRTAAEAAGFVDLVFELAPGPKRAFGDELELSLTGPSLASLSVPASSLLETATGTFVYALKDGFYLRTEVKTGPRAGAFVGIVDGLSPGESVVATPVEQLWLAELRLTKGGGHSH